MKPGELDIALIYGSNRNGRFCDTVAGWVVNKLKRHRDLCVDVLDPLHLNLPQRLEYDEGSAAVSNLKTRIERADGFVVVTPEYNHGYSAALKSVIDSVVVEWRAKPVAFVSYGGISGGLRAVEQLRPVFAELHATTIRDSVSFINAWDQFDSNGRLMDETAARSALESMLQSLKWWCHALRDARQKTPYAPRQAA